MTHTLVELAVPPTSHLGLIPAVHSVNVVPLDGLDLVHGHIPGKGHLGWSQDCNMGMGPDRLMHPTCGLFLGSLPHVSKGAKVIDN